MFIIVCILIPLAFHLIHLNVRVGNKTGNVGNIEARSCNHCCRGNAMSITHSECVFIALGMQHAMRMRRIVLPSVVCPAVPHFPHYLINGTIFGKESY
jgi:hypothetical protein